MVEHPHELRYIDSTPYGVLWRVVIVNTQEPDDNVLCVSVLGDPGCAPDELYVEVEALEAPAPGFRPDTGRTAHGATLTRHGAQLLKRALQLADLFIQRQCPDCEGAGEITRATKGTRHLHPMDPAVDVETWPCTRCDERAA